MRINELNLLGSLGILRFICRELDYPACARAELDQLPSLESDGKGFVLHSSSDVDSFDQSDGFKVVAMDLATKTSLDEPDWDKNFTDIIPAITLEERVCKILLDRDHKFIATAAVCGSRRDTDTVLATILAFSVLSYLGIDEISPENNNIIQIKLHSDYNEDCLSILRANFKRPYSTGPNGEFIAPILPGDKTCVISVRKGRKV